MSTCPNLFISQVYVSGKRRSGGPQQLPNDEENISPSLHGTSLISLTWNVGEIIIFLNSSSYA